MPDNLEIEVKFIIQRCIFEQAVKKFDIKKYQIQQIYIEPYYNELSIFKKRIPKYVNIDTWRIRQINDRYFLTAKTRPKDRFGIKRCEYEWEIDKTLFYAVKIKAESDNKKIFCIKKIRYLFYTKNDNFKVIFDDLQKVNSKAVDPDFIISEVEAGDDLTYDSPQKFYKQVLSNPELQFLKQGIDVTKIADFLNSYIAANGLISEKYEDIVNFADKRILL